MMCTKFTSLISPIFSPAVGTTKLFQKRALFFKINSSSLSTSASKSTLDLRGVYPPITTPFTSNEQISYDKLKINFQKWESVPFRGFVILGSTGEAVSLSNEECVEVVRFVRKEVSKDKLIICGSGCQSTKSTIELTQKMADIGADAALIISPSFYKGKMTDDALFSQEYLCYVWIFKMVADSSSIPIILYSVPANTNIDLSPSLIEKLSNHPNIIGLKDSGGDITKIGYIVHKTSKTNFQVLAGSAGFLYPALTTGCVGGIMALANILGESLCQLQKLVEEGKQDEARNLQHRLIGPNLCVTKRFGIAGVKAAMDLASLYGGPMRSPLLPLTQAEIKTLTDEFQSNGFLL